MTSSRSDPQSTLNAMQPSEKDEANASQHEAAQDRAAMPQTIAKLAHNMKNYLAQPGVDLHQPNLSSDSQNYLQNPEQNALQKSQQKVPLESCQNFERETSASALVQQAIQSSTLPLAEPLSEQAAVPRTHDQLGDNQDFVQQAPGAEISSDLVDLQTLPNATNAVSIEKFAKSTALPQDKIVTPAAPILPEQAANGFAVVAEPGASAEEARAVGALAPSSEVNFEQVEKLEKNADVQDNDEIVDRQPELVAITVPQEQLATSVIQSVSIERGQEKSAAEIAADNAPEQLHAGRAVRQCVKNTPNYSHTHKGITSAQSAKNVSPFETEIKDASSKQAEESTTKDQKVVPEDQNMRHPDPKNKLLGKRSYEEICRSYESMFAFDWDLRDINNLRHPPEREVTPIVVWLYINILYFPYNAQDLAKVSFEDFARPIFESLERVHGEPKSSSQVAALPPLADEKEQTAAKPNPDQQAVVAPNSQSAYSEILVEEERPDGQAVAMSQMTAQARPTEEALSQHKHVHYANYADLSGLPELISKLQIEEHFFEFRDMFKDKLQAVKEQLLTQIRDQDKPSEQQEDVEMDEDDKDKFLSELLSSDETKRDEELFDKILASFQESLTQLSDQNRSELSKQYSRFTNAYKEAESQANQILAGQTSLVQRPSFPYNPTKLHEYGLDFLSYVDPYYVADIRENQEWYLQNQNEVLLNVSYPSKQEKEFLRHIEQWQQEKNDLNYKRILQQLAEGGDDPNSDGVNGLNIQRYNSLSAHKRGLVVQEDAQCAICNNGDYEDEDLIVFCGACNIPVHQRCYGIDEIPDNDWICNNCWAFNMRRGIMVKCILCPKRGGAMKPTSIFRTYEHFMRYHTAAQKKKGLHHNNYFANLAASRRSSTQNTPSKARDGGESSQPAAKPTDQPVNNQQASAQDVKTESLVVSKQASSSRQQRLQFFDREDKNHALSQILSREGNFQEALIMQTKEAGETFPQNNVDLHFLESESIAEIPEDYTFFLQRNEQRLESQETVTTETLYEWVHLSCAMWIPGPSVTPKTPVRMSKIDIKRFDLQCIICGKRNCGACIQCQHSRCMISFHIECARRANYFLEVERVDRERNYRVFCEKHRPLKIVREMEEKDKQTVEEVQKFSKVIDRCLDIYARNELKQNRQKRLQPFSKPPQPEPPSKKEILAEKKQERLKEMLQKKQQKEAEIQQKKEQARIKKEKEQEMREQLKQKAAEAQAQKKAQQLAKIQETQKLKQLQQRQKELTKAQQKKADAAARRSATSNNDSRSKRDNSHSHAAKTDRSQQQVIESNTGAALQVVPPLAIRWKDKDKKILCERIRDKFIQLFKLRMNVIRVDPMIKINKKKELLQKKNDKEMRRIEKKRREKQQKKLAVQIAKKVLLSGHRSGLRSRNPSAAPGDMGLGSDAQQDLSHIVQQSEMSSQINQPHNDAAQTQNMENPEQENFFQMSNFDQQAGQNDSDSSELKERRPALEDLINIEETDPYYKFAAPTFVQEIDWAITFSKYDFPWHEVRFAKFSAKECYKKYTGMVRDAQTFYKKVLGGKEKYKKYIATQLDEAQRVFFGVLAEDGAVNQPVADQPMEAAVPVDGEDGAGESDIELFCICRGSYQSLTGYFVCCEAEGDCPNGGWLHPECTNDLLHMTQDEIMKLENWMCQDCRVRPQNSTPAVDPENPQPIEPVTEPQPILNPETPPQQQNKIVQQVEAPKPIQQPLSAKSNPTVEQVPQLGVGAKLLNSLEQQQQQQQQQRVVNPLMNGSTLSNPSQAAMVTVPGMSRPEGGILQQLTATLAQRSATTPVQTSSIVTPQVIAPLNTAAALESQTLKQGFLSQKGLLGASNSAQAQPGSQQTSLSQQLVTALGQQNVTATTGSFKFPHQGFPQLPPLRVQPNQDMSAAMAQLTQQLSRPVQSQHTQQQQTSSPPGNIVLVPQPQQAQQQAQIKMPVPQSQSTPTALPTLVNGVPLIPNPSPQQQMQQQTNQQQQSSSKVTLNFGKFFSK